MKGWILQWNSYVPGCISVALNVVPDFSAPESHSPSLLVVVWAMGSSLLHVMGWPTPTVMLAGEKLNFVIETFAAAAAAGVLAGGVACAAGGWAGLGCVVGPWAAGPGCSTSLRGALPTGIVSATLPVVT